MSGRTRKLSVEERKMIIKLHKSGKTQEVIAEIVGCTQSTVSAWICDWKRGRKSFEDRARSGRPTVLKGVVVSKVRKKLQKAIKSANDGFGHVSTQECKELIETEVGRVYSMRQVTRILHALGFSRVTPRPMHIKHDQKKVDKFRKNLKKNSRQSTWGLS